MATLLIRNATLLVTMDGQQREIPNGGFYADDGWIKQVDSSDKLPKKADEILNLDGHIVLPGLINTHHHLYQTLTRVVPQAQDADLFSWLKTLYPIWAGLTPESIHISTQLGLAELALSGCTTASDHHYIFPNDCRLDPQASQICRPEGGRFQQDRPNHGHIQDVGLELHQQIAARGASVHAELLEGDTGVDLHGLEDVGGLVRNRFKRSACQVGGGRASGEA